MRTIADMDRELKRLRREVAQLRGEGDRTVDESSGRLVTSSHLSATVLRLPSRPCKRKTTISE